MASPVKKKKGKQLYYYVVESARVDGKPRIVHQAYLGTADKVAALVQDRTAPVPLSATSRDFGLPGALWLAAEQTGLWRAGIALACSAFRPFARPLSSARRHPPHLSTRAKDRSRRLVRPNHSASEWGIPPNALPRKPSGTPSNRFCRRPMRPTLPRTILWIRPSCVCSDLWKEKQMVSRRLFAYDTTNFYTYIASTNTRNELAQRGHNKQGRHNLRQVGLSYVLDGENGLSLCHHVYRGNVADVEEFSIALARIVRLLDHNQIARDTVTLVFDKGSAALANTVELERAGVGWISALPWNQAPAELRERAAEELPPCSAEQPGVRAAAEKLLVHGQEYLCVLKYSAPFAGEQLHSLTTSLSRVLQSLRRFSMELNKPRSRWTEEEIRRKIEKWLSGQFLAELIRYQLESRDGQWRLQFDFDHAAFAASPRSSLGPHRAAHQPHGLDRGASGGRLFRPARDRARLSRPERRRVAELGTDVSLDRPQDPHPCVSTACWASLSCSMSIDRPKPPGAIFPWNNFWKSCVRFSSSFCSTRRKARKARIARLTCSRSRRSRSRPWPRR